MRQAGALALRGAALALLCLAMLTARVVLSSRALLARGEAALSAGRSDEAVRTLGRAARLHAPLSPYAERARQALLSLGAAAEGRGDGALALLAYRELRSAILATRSVYTPAPALLSRANERIAALMAAAEAADPELSREPLPERQAFHARALARDELPRTGWTLVALLGAALFIGGGFALALRGVGEDGRLLRRPAAKLLALSLLGLGVMVLGLFLA